MIQEIIVMVLFVSVLAYFAYRFFFRKGSKGSGGCQKCMSNEKNAKA